MNIYFCQDLSLEHALLDYLTLYEKTQCRKTSTKWFQTTNSLNWPHYVKTRVPVIQCNICRAMHLQKTCEFCPLCEQWISVEHLVRCQGCREIYCCRCVCDQCQ
jgi:hypothetical protein